MTIVFIYQSLFTFLFTTIPILIGYIFLIEAGAREWETMEYPRTLMLIGLTNFILNLSIFFIPFFALINGTSEEVNIYTDLIYGTTFSQFLISSVILGVALIFLGINNKNNFGRYLILAGILVIISELALFCLRSVVWLYVELSNASITILIFWILITGGWAILPFIVLIQYGSKIENKAIITAGILLIYGEIMSMLVVDSSTMGFGLGLIFLYASLLITELFILFINKKQKAGELIQCEKCGQKNKSDDKFCYGCGELL